MNCEQFAFLLENLFHLDSPDAWGLFSLLALEIFGDAPAGDAHALHLLRYS